MHIQYQLIQKHNTQIITHANSEGDGFTMYKNTIQYNSTQSCILLLTFSSSNHLSKSMYVSKVVWIVWFCPTYYDHSPEPLPWTSDHCILLGYGMVCFRWTTSPSASCSRAYNVLPILMMNTKTLSGLLVRFMFYTKRSFKISYLHDNCRFDIQMTRKNQNTLKFPASYLY